MVRLQWVLLADGSRELQYQQGTPVMVEGSIVPGEYVWGEWLTVQTAVVDESRRASAAAGDDFFSLMDRYVVDQQRRGRL